MPPPSCTWRATSAVRRVLPIPASPETRTACPLPRADACFQVSRRAVELLGTAGEWKGSLGRPGGKWHRGMGEAREAPTRRSPPALAPGGLRARVRHSDVKLWPPRPRARRAPGRPRRSDHRLPQHRGGGPPRPACRSSRCPRGSRLRPKSRYGYRRDSSGPRPRNAYALCWMATAAATASEALWNIANPPSPRPLIRVPAGRGRRPR